MGSFTSLIASCFPDPDIAHAPPPLEQLSLFWRPSPTSHSPATSWYPNPQPRGRCDQPVTGRDMDCEDVWRGLLNPAPVVAEADPNKEIGSSINHIEPKLGTDVEFVAGQDAVIADASIPLPFANNAQVCQFIALDFQSVQPGMPKPTIFYDTQTGVVLLDLDRVF